MGSDIVGHRLARQAVEAVEQTIAPQLDRVALLKQRERADAACPLELTEQGIVGIERLISAEEGLRLQRRAQRRETCAKPGKPSVAVGDESLQRLAYALFATGAKILTIPVGNSLQDIECDKRKDRRDQSVSEARIMARQAPRRGTAEQSRRVRIGIFQIIRDGPGIGDPAIAVDENWNRLAA